MKPGVELHPPKLQLARKASVAATIKEVVMLYNHENSAEATVVDMDSGKVLSKVLEVNTWAGWVKVHTTLDAQGRAAGERIRFGSIYAIQGLESMPCLFHCYGKLQ